MATLLNNNDVLQVTVKQRLYNQVLLNVLKYRFEVGNEPGYSLEEAAADLRAMWYDPVRLDAVGRKMMEVQSNFLVHEGIMVQRIGPSLSIAIHEPIDTTGTIETDPRTANVALTITKYTETPGRRGRGSFHLGGPDIEDVADGQWANFGDAGRNALAAALSTIITVAGKDVSFRPGLYNPRAANPTFVPVTNCVPQRTVRVQRRRTVGVGI